MTTCSARSFDSEHLPGVDKVLLREVQLKANGATIHTVNQVIMLYICSDPSQKLHVSSEKRLRAFAASGVI